ncbi:hypothetical protein QUA74_01210 [Microcoleus sp. LAD1_D3]|uniref:hypothetical protein n=1 Tax=Microcoleus sp. LAD1_D3 TaxID=2819365 RepID=UPI002FCF813E
MSSAIARFIVEVLPGKPLLSREMSSYEPSSTRHPLAMTSRLALSEMCLFIQQIALKKCSFNVSPNEEGQPRGDYPYLNNSDFVAAVPVCQSSNSAIAGLLAA